MSFPVTPLSPDSATRRDQSTEQGHEKAEETSNSTKEKVDDAVDYVYIISHDVRSSVRALLEIPNWIKEDLEDAGHEITGALAENIDLMNIHTARLERMLTDLLEYSRIGRMQTVEMMHLQAVLDQALASEPLPSGFHVEQDFQAEQIDFGTRDIMTLFYSFLSNSVKHHGGDAGRVYVGSRQTADGIVLSFADDGPGIPENQRERVFRAMTTLKARDEVEGSGMGLANVSKIVKRYNGKILWAPIADYAGVSLEIHFPQAA